MSESDTTIGRPATWPLQYENAYSEEIVAVVEAMDEQAGEEIETGGQDLLDAAQPEEDRPTGVWDELLNLMLLRIALRASDRVLALETAVRRYALQINAFNAADFTKSVLANYNTDPRRGNEPWLRSTLQAFENENLSLVRSIPEQYVNRLRGEFVRAVLEGRGVTELRSAVRDATTAAKARAGTISRDQVGRLMTQLQERRHRDAGVSHYRWVTMADERVRPTHRIRHNRIYEWDAPGIKPGTEIACRCVSAAVFPALTVRP